MQPLPHRYTASATGGPEGPVPVGADELPTIETAPSAGFGGDGERWSPEQLLMGAIADSFVLTFRVVAASAILEWRHLSCQVEGLLERDGDRAMRFAEVRIQAEAIVPAESQRVTAARCLDQAEQRCLLTNSMTATVQLHHHITVSAD